MLTSGEGEVMEVKVFCWIWVDMMDIWVDVVMVVMWSFSNSLQKGIFAGSRFASA